MAGGAVGKTDFQQGDVVGMKRCEQREQEEDFFQGTKGSGCNVMRTGASVAPGAAARRFPPAASRRRYPRAMGRSRAKLNAVLVTRPRSRVGFSAEKMRAAAESGVPSGEMKPRMSRFTWPTLRRREMTSWPM